MIAFGFRTKLLSAMMLLVAGVTGATIYLTQNQIEQTYQRAIDAQIQQRVTSFSDLQEARLGSTKQRCLELNKSVRLSAAMDEGDLRAAPMIRDKPFSNCAMCWGSRARLRLPRKGPARAGPIFSAFWMQTG